MDTHKHAFKAAKLLISFVDRRRGDMLVSVTKSAGARGGTIVLGRTIGDNRLLRALSLADISQDIVFTIMGDECEAVLKAVEKASSIDPRRLGGMAVLLDVKGMLFRVPQSGDVENTDKNSMSDKEQHMESGYKLITAIVNHGHADDLMLAARKAGASGGTILTARGTGTEEDVVFFGICLVPEKEMLLIVSEDEKVDAVMEAINANDEIQQPGGGVMYTMNVEKFMLLGKKRSE